MATYNSILKPASWITADDFGEWMYDDKPERYEVPAGAFAVLLIQDILYTAKNIGVIGNGITIEYTAGAVQGAEVVNTVGNDITVQIESGVSTAEDIRTAVASSGPASALVNVALQVIAPDQLSEVQVRTQTAPEAQANLADGVDDIAFPKADVPIRRKRFELLINSACSKIESIIQTIVLAKDFQEDSDGNDSNVIVPSQWPILSLDTVKIDFNRNFGPSTIVDQINIILRGMADKRQDVGASDIRIVGNDIYLRDDDNDNVIGRIFSGSVAGSVRVNYKAGWARDIDDVPDDLRLATLQLTEWYERRRSNKDIGIGSKGVRGESYSKQGEMTEGIPTEIYDLIAPYINMSFGMFERMQNNIMGL